MTISIILYLNLVTLFTGLYRACAQTYMDTNTGLRFTTSNGGVETIITALCVINDGSMFVLPDAVIEGSQIDSYLYISYTCT